MARLLTVHNAEVNTASITIRTLQIEGKQVTLSVFRQIAVEDIVCEQPLSLRGVGWGHVNYLINWKYYDQGDIHLIWQKGNELRRCMVRQGHEPWTFKPPEGLNRNLHYFNNDAAWAAAEAEHRQMQENALRSHQAQMDQLRRRNALIAPLFDLPQLFIAV